MKITDFSIQGLRLFEPKTFADTRGFFTERFNAAAMFEAGLKGPFVQDNFSRSRSKVLRGLHYQFEKPQAKLVTCMSGVIVDVAVDLRADSKAYGKHIQIELSGDRPQWFWIPAGFAHGFCVVSKEPADVMYKVDHYYNAKGEAGLLWSDPDLGISWPMSDVVLSSKDEVLGSWKSYQNNPRF